MKLAFCLFKYFPYGGLQRDLYDVARLCAERGHRVRVYALDWQGERPPGVGVERITVAARRNHVRYARFHQVLTRRLREDPPDLLIGFNKLPGLDLYYAADPCYRSGMATRPWWHRIGPRYRHFLAYEAAVFGRHAATRILTLTAPQEAEYRAAWGTPASRCECLPPGIRPGVAPSPEVTEQRQCLRRELGVAPEEHLLLLIGSGFRTKGLDRALAALRALPEDLSRRTRLLVIGQDKASRFRRRVRHLGLGARVLILPGRDDIPAILQAGDLLVHPAYREVAGKVILEAIVAGLPVLVTDVCGYAPHVAQAEAGLVLPSPFDQGRMNRALAEMLASPQRAAWRANGIRYGQERDLYGLPRAVVAAIEAVPRRQRPAR